MAIKKINVGDNPNEGKGDPIRTGFQKVNDNFAEIANLVDEAAIVPLPDALAGEDDYRRMTAAKTRAVLDATLGSAGYESVESFATAIQGAKAETAVQPEAFEPIRQEFNGVAEAAQTSAAKAEFAAEAAALTGALYNTQALGEAATPVGKVFQSVSATVQGAIEVRLRTAAGSDLRKTVPSSERVSSLESKTAPMAVARSIITDFDNKLGGGSAVYIPRAITLRNAVSGVIFNRQLAADTKLTDWHKVPATYTTATRAYYYDSVDNLVKEAVSGVSEMPIDPARYFHLLTIWGNESGATSGIVSNYKVESTVNRETVFANANNALAFDRALSKLYLPTMYGYYKGGFSWTLSPPADNLFREIDVPSSGAIYHVWLDVWDLIQNGATSSTAVKVTQGFAGTNMINGKGEGGLLLIGTGLGRQFSPAINISTSTVCPNEFGSGREDNDTAERFSDSNEPVALTEAVSLGLGFTRGYRDTRSTNGRPYYGGLFKQPRNCGVVMYRFFLEASADEAFGTPRAYLFRRGLDGTETNSVRTPVLVKKHSPRVREYMEYANLSDGAFYTGLWCGAHETTEKVKVFGVQFACVSDSFPWISKADYPRAFEEIGRKLRGSAAVDGDLLPLDAVIPTDVWMIDERRYPIYIDQLTRRMAEGGRLRASAMKVVSGNTDVADVEQVTGGTIRLKGANNDTVRILLHDKADRLDRHVYGDVKLHIVPQSAIAALPPINMHCIGDSLTNSTGTMVNAIRRMVAMGATINSFGGRIMTSLVPGDGTMMGEGRSSKEFADYIYEKTDVVTPTTAAAYNAASDSAKANLNPYLRAAMGGDDPSLVYNGYVFDFRYYLDSFGYPDPNVIVVNLGTNDMSRNTAATAVLRLQHGLQVMVSQIRAACPNALVILPFNAYGRMGTEARWAGNQWDGLKVFQSFVRARADGKILLLPAYCGVNRDLGFQNSVTLDALTGINTAITSDATHYSDVGIRQFGEMAAQSILAKLVLG